MQTYGDITLDITELMAGDPDALPGQGTYEQVLDGSYNTDNGWPGLARHLSAQRIGACTTASASGSMAAIQAKPIRLNCKTTRQRQRPKHHLMNGSWSGLTSSTRRPARRLIRQSGHEIGDGTLNDNPGWGNAEFEFYTDDPANASTDGDGNLLLPLTNFPKIRISSATTARV